MDWFLYDNDLRHERVKSYLNYKMITSQFVLSVAHIKNFFIS